MRKFKKTMSVLLAAIMTFSAFSALPFTASAAEVEARNSVGAESGDYEYEILDDGTASITNYSGYDTELTIPSEIDGYKVTSIGIAAFEWNNSLTSVTIPDCVTSIGSSAFYECDNLTSIQLPNGLNRIENWTFESCTGLTNIIIPNGVVSIGTRAFSDCASLSSIIIPDNVTTIDDMAFYNCDNLTNISIPKNVESIGYEAFGNSKNLASISVDENNPNYASLDGVLFSKNLKTLICYPAGKTNTYYVIPNCVTEISESAFSGCNNLESITITENITQIDTFNLSLGNLKAINVENNDNFTSVDGVLFDKSKETLIKYPAGKEEESYSIPFGTISIGDYAFYRSQHINHITVPESVTHIGNSAFWGSYNLVDVTLPDSITHIGSRVFYDTACRNITLPDSVISLGRYDIDTPDPYESYVVNDIIYTGKIAYYASFNSSSTTGSAVIKNGTIAIADGAFARREYETIILPGSLINIGNNAFKECCNLSNITIPKNVTDIGCDAFTDCNLSEVTIPANVKNIGEHAFGYTHPFNYDTLTYEYFKIDNFTIKGIKGTAAEQYATDNGFNFIDISGTYDDPSTQYDYTILEDGTIQLTKYNGNDTDVEIPFEINGQKVTSIGNNAFSECNTIYSIVIPDSVTSIGNAAFSNCSTLESISIPDSVTSIGNAAFSNCSTLESISIPDSVESIGSSAFSWCERLKNIIIPDSVTIINDYTFFGCEKLESITISNNVTSIGNSAFMNCYSLLELSIPDGVTSIANCAFENCSLESIVIPKSVTSIEPYAFYNCDYVIIYGYKGTTAEEYANEHELLFEALDKEITGDIDGDGTLSVADATAIQKHLASLDELTPEQLALADFNGDGTLNVKDATAIQRALVNS
ncbi:leucine-rich repeat protein [Ruminococcus sp.]|uniref:leucine-rich repeat protein n=1 Tax=Ruminococcus sp. TaxID=41978 RepID=UPI0025DBDEBA|nr:leucine-rich repeat protein [Ruminococcus sp.]MCI6616952.1 leucine-rich repeat protein [Ruminococcus sp.]